MMLFCFFQFVLLLSVCIVTFSLYCYFQFVLLLSVCGPDPVLPAPRYSPSPGHVQDRYTVPREVEDAGAANHHSADQTVNVRYVSLLVSTSCGLNNALLHLREYHLQDVAAQMSFRN